MGDFRDFIRRSNLGGTGNRYEFGSDPLKDMENIEDLLYHINVLSKAALNKLENSNVENPYIKRQLIKAKRELREAYLRIMDI